MTKREIATKIAEHMNRINGNVNIKRQTKVLMQNMIKSELENALKSYEK